MLIHRCQRWCAKCLACVIMMEFRIQMILPSYLSCQQRCAVILEEVMCGGFLVGTFGGD
jgi:hypothetical protein